MRRCGTTCRCPLPPTAGTSVLRCADFRPPIDDTLRDTGRQLIESFGITCKSTLNESTHGNPCLGFMPVCCIQVYGRSLVGITGSNPAAGIDVCVLSILCVVQVKACATI